MPDSDKHNERQTKRVDQLTTGDVVADLEPFSLGSFATVRWAEPFADAPGRYAVLFAGGETADMRGTCEVQIATADEVSAHEARLADASKRARIRAGLKQVIDLLDAGLPLPSFLRVEMPIMPDPESVRAVAKALGVEPVESLNGGRPQIDAATVLATSPEGREEVEFKAWHLASKALAES